MTTFTDARALLGTPATGGNRIWNVVRLGWINRWTVIYIPAMILGFIFLINLFIWWIVYLSAPAGGQEAALAGTQYSGASTYIFIYVMVIAIQAMNSTFAYALGMSISRREFSLGTSASLVLLTAFWGTVLTVLSFLEEWTNGWGFGGHIFTAVYFGSGAVWERLFTFGAGFLFFAFTGILWGTIYLRWRAYGLYIAGALSILLSIGALALIGLTNSWGAVGDWFVAAGPTGVVACLLIPTAVNAVVGHLLLMRSTPKS